MCDAGVGDILACGQTPQKAAQAFMRKLVVTMPFGRTATQKFNCLAYFILRSIFSRIVFGCTRRTRAQSKKEAAIVQRGNNLLPLTASFAHMLSRSRPSLIFHEGYDD